MNRREKDGYPPLNSKQFAAEYIVPEAERIEREGRLPESVIEGFRSQGILGAMLPKEYGGLELNSVELGQLACDIGGASGSAQTLLTVHGMCALAILRWGTHEQRQSYLTRMAGGNILGAFALSEPDVGSDAGAIGCTAELACGGYVLNGTKKWITMSQVADLWLLLTSCEGTPTAFIVHKEDPGLSLEPIDNLLGLRGSMMAEIHLRNCFIPQERLIGKIGAGVSHVASHSLEYGRYTVAWGCVGAAKACLMQALDYSRKRKQYGVPIRKHQLVQKMLAEIVVHTRAAEALCYQAGRNKDAKDPRSIFDTVVAKYYASKAMQLAAANAVQIMGANGCVEGQISERCYRDAKVMEIIEGSSQILEMLIANSAFRAE